MRFKVGDVFEYGSVDFPFTGIIYKHIIEKNITWYYFKVLRGSFPVKRFAKQSNMYIVSNIISNMKIVRLLNET